MDYQTILQRKAVLDNARVELKKRFFGIDFIIDDVINRITSWYIFPDLNTRPSIICLWGMTGVGKTDLIRNLTSLLKLGESFMEIQLSGNSSGYGTIASSLKYSKIEPNRQGILLLDEIQRYRTVTEDGSEKNEYPYSDIWMLLSDGRLPTTSALDEMLDLLFDVKASEDRRAKKKAEKEDGEDSSTEDDDTNISTWRAKHLKKELQLDQSIDDITKWTSVDVGNIITKLKKQDFLERSYDDYSRLLIVISGNLDEAFREAFNVDDADMDADLMHEMTKRINMLTIKNALLRRFKPEQIARFGNNHITYPTLSRTAFEQIIKRALDNYFSFLKERSGITLSMKDDTIIKFIYDNSVFPAQGTRPVLSTISDFTNVCFPHVILNAIAKNNTNITITCDNSHLCSSQGDKIYYKADVEEIRKNAIKDINFQSLVAVHESGHAIAQILLFNTTPFLLRLHDNASGGAAWNIASAPSDFATKQKVKVLYAGKVAEELVFGKENATSGCVRDIYEATTALSVMFRNTASGQSKLSIVDPSQTDSYRYDIDIMPSNDEMTKLSQELYEATTTLIKNNLPYVLSLAKQLLEVRKMNSHEIKAFLNEKHPGVFESVKALNDDQVNTVLYPYSYEDALKNK